MLFSQNQYSRYNRWTAPEGTFPRGEPQPGQSRVGASPGYRPRQFGDRPAEDIGQRAFSTLNNVIKRGLVSGAQIELLQAGVTGTFGPGRTGASVEEVLHHERPSPVQDATSLPKKRRKGGPADVKGGPGEQMTLPF